ncbi:MAG: hypothetical protein RIS19_862, partial [Actinomycetota bacterium]
NIHEDIQLDSMEWNAEDISFLGPQGISDLLGVTLEVTLEIYNNLLVQLLSV